jgi:hypothetical protein
VAGICFWEIEMFVSCFVQAHKLNDKIHNVDLNTLTNEEVSEVMHFSSHYTMFLFPLLLVTTWLDLTATEMQTQLFF